MRLPFPKPRYYIAIFYFINLSLLLFGIAYKSALKKSNKTFLPRKEVRFVPVQLCRFSLGRRILFIYSSANLSMKTKHGLDFGTFGFFWRFRNVFSTWTVILIFLPFLGIFKNFLHHKLFFSCILNFPQAEGPDEMKSRAVSDMLIASFYLSFHEHSGFDVMNFRIGALSASMHEAHDGLVRSRIFEDS